MTKARGKVKASQAEMTKTERGKEKAKERARSLPAWPSKRHGGRGATSGAVGATPAAILREALGVTVIVAVAPQAGLPSTPSVVAATTEAARIETTEAARMETAEGGPVPVMLGIGGTGIV